MSQHCGGFDDPSSIASRPSIFVFGSRGIPIANLEEMNGPRRTACFAKGMPNYNFFTLDSTWFEYTDLLPGVVDNSGSHEQYATSGQLTADNPVSRSCQTRHGRTDERTNGLTDNVQIFVSLRLLTSLCETIMKILIRQWIKQFGQINLSRLTFDQHENGRLSCRIVTHCEC